MKKQTLASQPEHRRMIEDVLAAASQMAFNYPPERRADHLHGIGLIYGMIGDRDRSRAVLQTAEIIRDSEDAQKRFRQYFLGETLQP